MSSELNFNKIVTTGGSTITNVIQHVVATAQVGGSTSFPASNFDNLPSSTGGVQLLTTSFTPRFSNSRILIETSNIPMSESSNNTNQFRIFAHAGSTLLGWSMSGIWNGNFSGSLATNLSGQYLHVLANSWGTDTRTIRLAVDADLNSTSSVNIHYSYGGSWLRPDINLTITEYVQ
jgi:hypothetical protein